MPRFQIAHIKEQGVDLIIVPLEPAFGDLPQIEQDRSISDLQAHAIGAKLAGTVVPVWEMIDGRMGFRAPQRWHPFFHSIDMQRVAMNLNGELYW